MTYRDYAWLLPGAALALAAGILIGRAAAAWVLFIPLVLCAALACWLLKWPQRFAGAMAVVLAVGCLLGYVAYHPALPREGEYTVSGVVAEDIRLREDGQVRSLLRDVTLNGERLPSGAYWSFYLKDEEPLPEGLTPGCRITVTAQVYHPGGADNPGGYDFREYLLQKNVTIGVYGRNGLQTEASWHPMGMAAALRHRLSQWLMQAMGQQAGEYASTLLLGSQNLIPESDRQAFSRLGIAHILSVSGFHVGVLAGLMSKLLWKLRLSRKLRFAVTAAVLAVYCWLTGMNAPVLRAAMLFLLFEFGALRHRQRSSLHLLSAAWIIQLALSPAQLTSLSFQLTYGAMLGLTLVAPWLKGLWTPKHLEKPWNGLCQALGAQIGILLPELYWFQELPLLGIGLNVLVLGAATGLIMLCWVTLALLPFPPLAALVGRLTALLLDGMLMVVRSLGEAPGITLWTCRANLLTAVAWVLLVAGMSWWWRKRRVLAIALSVALLVVSVFPWPQHGTQYVQLSVGEADAAVLQDEGFSMAIDTGEDGEALTSYLHQRRISLDALVLTHLHADHAAGVTALVESRIPVTRCYLPWDAEKSLVDEEVLAALEQLRSTGTEIVYVARGDEITLPSGKLTVLWPERDRVRPNQDANLYSMALLAELHGSTMLLTGDLEGACEMYAAAPADVLKAAHHGSESSTSPAFLQAVAPRLLLLSCGSEERSASMEARRGDIPMADTSVNGAVTINFEPDGFTVETMR